MVFNGIKRLFNGFANGLLTVFKMVFFLPFFFISVVLAGIAIAFSGVTFFIR